MIVVDNASTDGSPDLVATEFPGVRLIRNTENVGFARANNQGLRAAQGRYLLLLNSDTEVQGNSLADMVRYLDEHPDVGVVGGSLRNADGSRQVAADAFPLRPWDMAWQRIVDFVWPANTLTRRGRMSLWSYEAPLEVDWVLGAALMIRRTTMLQVGLLSERFFMYAEDLEWCYRVKQAGWKLVHLPDAAIYHIGGGSSRRASMQQRMHDRSLVGFYQLHYGPAAAAGLWLVLFAKELTR